MAIGQAQVTSTQEARRGLEEMARELMRAPVAEITDEGGASAWPPDDTWTTIRFRYPEGVDSSGAVDDWSSYITYTLDEDEDQLVRTDDTGETRVLANGVTSLTFEPGDVAEEVRIQLMTEDTATTGHTIEQPLGVRIRVRNE